MSELKKCPFCGSDAKSVNCGSPMVVCLQGCCQIVSDTKAVDRWNTRPLEDALAAELELYKALAKAVNTMLDVPLSDFGDTLKSDYPVMTSEALAILKELEKGVKNTVQPIDDFERMAMLSEENAKLRKALTKIWMLIVNPPLCFVELDPEVIFVANYLEDIKKITQEALKNG